MLSALARTINWLNSLTLRNLIDYRTRSFLAHIIDNDVSTEPRKHQGIRAAKPSASASNDDRLTIEADIRRSLFV